MIPQDDDQDYQLNQGKARAGRVHEHHL